MLIVFPRQQWFHERSSMLRYTYIAYLVYVFRRTDPSIVNVMQLSYDDATLFRRFKTRLS